MVNKYYLKIKTKLFILNGDAIRPPLQGARELPPVCGRLHTRIIERRYGHELGLYLIINV